MAAGLLAFVSAVAAPPAPIPWAQCEYFEPGFWEAFKKSSELNCPEQAPVFNLLVSQDLPPLPQWTRADPKDRHAALNLARLKARRDWEALNAAQQHTIFMTLQEPALARHRQLLKARAKLETVDPRMGMTGKREFLEVDYLVGFAILGGHEFGERYLGMQKTYVALNVSKWTQKIIDNEQPLLEALQDARDGGASLNFLEGKR